MKILFDLSATQPSHEARFHGGSEYSKYIFTEAIKNGFKFDVCYNAELELPSEIESALEDSNFTELKFTTNQELRKLIDHGDYDRFYSANPYLYDDFDFRKTKFYMTIHGLRELEMFSFLEQIPYRISILSKVKTLIKEIFFKKHLYNSYKRRIGKLLRIKNKHIITISQHSLYSILSFFPELNKETITVAHSPIDFSTSKHVPNNNDPYFLLVSGNRWIKNNLRAIKALDQLFSSGQLSDVKVVVLGCENVDFKSKIKNPGRFEFIGYVSQQKLDWYFQNAFSFIYPTLNEGFGYPPLQAMKYGTPVLASAISSVPEVCKDAALYFNPFSISEMKNRILNCYTDKDLRESLTECGFQRIEKLKTQQTEMTSNMMSVLFK